MSSNTIFLLSPARLDGERAKLLLNPGADFELARAIREPHGAPLGDVFSFLSGLYFRGKFMYANAFADPPAGVAPLHVITTHRGLLPPDLHVRRRDLEDFAVVDIGTDDPRFREPLVHAAKSLCDTIAPSTRVVLLGSIATGKYVDPLLGVFRERLLFPASFVGRGDMSRGGLLLRSARSGTELEYLKVANAVRRGARPPRLDRIPRRNPIA